jgi:hypothetical protein
MFDQSRAARDLGEGQAFSASGTRRFINSAGIGVGLRCHCRIGAAADVISAAAG